MVIFVSIWHLLSDQIWLDKMFASTKNRYAMNGIDVEKFFRFVFRIVFVI